MSKTAKIIISKEALNNYCKRMLRTVVFLNQLINSLDMGG